MCQQSPSFKCQLQRYLLRVLIQEEGHILKYIITARAVRVLQPSSYSVERMHGLRLNNITAEETDGQSGYPYVSWGRCLLCLFPAFYLSLPASYRGQESAVWRLNKLFGRGEAEQELTEVSVEPDAAKKGLHKDSQQPRSGSLRDSGGLKNNRLISPRRNDADLDASIAADGFECMSTHRSSCYSDRRRWQEEEEDPSRE